MDDQIDRLRAALADRYDLDGERPERPVLSPRLRDYSRSLVHRRQPDAFAKCLEPWVVVQPI